MVWIIPSHSGKERQRRQRGHKIKMPKDISLGPMIRNLRTSTRRHLERVMTKIVKKTEKSTDMAEKHGTVGNKNK